MKSNRWRLVFLGVAPVLCGTASCATASTFASDPQQETGELSAGSDARTIAPSDLTTRYVTCPVRATNESATATFRGKTYAYKSDAQIDYKQAGWESRATFDDHALDGLVPSDASAMLIDIRRVNGKPAYAYYGANGDRHATYDPWSSSKFIAASAAMGRVRKESSGRVGARSAVNGYAIGDLVTSMHAYRPSGKVNAESNEIAGYFLTVAGASYSNSLFQDRWLNLSNDESTFHLSTSASRIRSAWGYDPFSPGSRVWRDASGESFSTSPETRMVDEKSISALAQGEWLKRLSQQELVPENGLPNLQRADVDVLFYGAPGSANAGGMLSSVSKAQLESDGLDDFHYVAGAIAGTQETDSAATTKDRLEQKVGRNWRIFQKQGWGNSTARSRSEVVLASYTCLPDYDGGHEFVLVVRTSVPLSSINDAGEVARTRVRGLVSAALAAR